MDPVSDRHEPAQQRADWIELAWIEAGHGHVRRLSLLPGRLRFGELLSSSPVRDLLNALGWGSYAWSVFGQKRSPDEIVSVRDRIELLPPLFVDPKVARLRRVEHNRRQQAQRGWRPQRFRERA